MTKETIYLAGPMRGKTDRECNEWRDDATMALSDYYNILSPMTRDMRGKEATHAEYIVREDKKDIVSSDVVLANTSLELWDSNRFGTPMEIHFGFMLRKHVVVISDRPLNSGWLNYHSDYIVKTLPEAVIYLKARAIRKEKGLAELTS